MIVEVPASSTKPAMCRSSGPTYSDSGRMSAFDAACSMMCAVQPTTRAATNSGVKVRVSNPIRLYAGPDG